MVLITYNENEIIALFQHIEAQKSCKHLTLYITEKFIHIVEEKQIFDVLFNLLTYVFNTYLDLTHNVKGVKTCKVHCKDSFMQSVYRDFANSLEKLEYKVKIYRGWIEITSLK